MTLEAISKIHLTPNTGVVDGSAELVAGLLKMLTLYSVRPLTRWTRLPVQIGYDPFFNGLNGLNRQTGKLNIAPC